MALIRPGSIPENFLDPITEELMPMLTSDMRTYDAKTIERLNYISPFTKHKFCLVQENLLLSSKIEDFVSAQEKVREQKRSSSNSNKLGLASLSIYANNQKEKHKFRHRIRKFVQKIEDKLHIHRKPNI